MPRQRHNHFTGEHYPISRELEIDLDELDQMHVVAEWLAQQGRLAAYVSLPDGPLSPSDADLAVEAVVQAVCMRLRAPVASHTPQQGIANLRRLLRRRFHTHLTPKGRQQLIGDLAVPLRPVQMEAQCASVPHLLQ